MQTIPLELANIWIITTQEHRAFWEFCHHAEATRFFWLHSSIDCALPLARWKWEYSESVEDYEVFSLLQTWQNMVK